jgi:putative addiction module killer protein
MAHQVQTTEEFDDWLDGLRDRKGRAIIVARVLRMEAGLLGDVKPVGEGVMEARIAFWPG